MNKKARFTLAEATRLLKAALAVGMPATLHIDEAGISMSINDKEERPARKPAKQEEIIL